MSLNDQDVEKQELNDSIYGDYRPNDQNALLIKWQEDLDPVLNNLYHDLKSEVYFEGKWQRIILGTYTNEKGEQVTEYMPPKMEEKEINDLIGHIKPIICHNTMLGSHKEKKISRILIRTSDDISFYLSQLVGNLKINIATAHLIDNTFSQLINNTYYRGINNQERVYAGKTQKSVNMIKQEYVTDKVKNVGEMQ